MCECESVCVCVCVCCRGLLLIDLCIGNMFGGLSHSVDIPERFELKFQVSFFFFF